MALLCALASATGCREVHPGEPAADSAAGRLASVAVASSSAPAPPMPPVAQLRSLPAGAPLSARSGQPAGAPSAARGAPVPLAQRLLAEARLRRPAPLRAEAVLDALDQRGVPIVKRLQYVGAVVGAAYCLGGNTRSGLALSVCEYGDEGAALQGRELTLSRFHTIPREVLIRGRTTLTLSFTGATAATPTETARITRIFASL